MYSFRTLSAFFFFTIAIGCGQSSVPSSTIVEKNQSSELEQKVIYGVDNRIDYYQIASRKWKTKARSTVALMYDYKIQTPSTPWDPKQKLELNLDSYSESYGLCSSEAFYEQSIGAFCSGSLVGPDLIMTAGHCVEDQASCEQTSFVFDFSYKNAKKPPTKVKAGNVYSCKKLIHSEVINGRGSDFALVQLDREVQGRKPLEVRRTGAVETGDALSVIGYPTGLPLKFADGARVRNTVYDEFFVASLDTYGGNSGSPVFNDKTKKIEGILVRGENDYVYNGLCRVSNQCADDGCRGEDVTRVERVLPYLDNHLAQ